MTLLADESVDYPIIERLRSDGHAVEAVADALAGSSDPVVLARSVQQGSVLLTSDKDFGELVFRQKLPHVGVVLLRLFDLEETAVCDRTSDVIAQFASQFPGAFSVVTPDDVRIRPGP